MHYTHTNGMCAVLGWEMEYEEEEYEEEGGEDGVAYDTYSDGDDAGGWDNAAADDVAVSLLIDDVAVSLLIDDVAVSLLEPMLE
jgi:hypothetical protein